MGRGGGQDREEEERGGRLRGGEHLSNKFFPGQVHGFFDPVSPVVLVLVMFPGFPK